MSWIVKDRAEDEPNSTDPFIPISYPMPPLNDTDREIVEHLKEYLDVIRDEPAKDKMLMYKLFHDLNRILGNEE